MKKITMLILAIALIGSGAFAQNNRVFGGVTNQPFNDAPSTRTCGTMDVNDPASVQAFEDAIAPHVAAYLQNAQNGGSPEAIYTIPTIVHVIHNSSEGVGVGRNIPNSKIQEQMTILNDDFRRTNSDASNTPAYFTGVAADCEINFCLITTYPSGHPNAGNALPEAGVDRVDATTIGVGNTSSGYPTGTIDGTIKPATSWNPNEVMNIWVCQLQSGLLGYATFPNSGPANQDGTVMGYQYFGLTGGAFGLGRTTTHEVGHWLGCYHIWGDDGNACGGSDQCADTPNQAGATGGCPSGVQTDACTGGNGIMYQNYMDYSNDACMNIFTQDQKARMQSTMATQPRRSTLNGFSSTLCAAPNLTAEFSANTTTINAGQTVTFTDASVGPNTITSWTWDFDVTALGGVTPGTASTQGAHVVTYNNAGTYTVSLQVGDGSTTDLETKNSYIIVNPAGTQICDSTAATWDIVVHGATTGAGYWGPDCNGTAPSGYILGQNCYADNGWCDKITYSGSGDFLTDVFFYFGTATGGGNVNLKVWGETAGAPNNGNVMAQQSVAISSLATGGTATLWSLASPPALTSDFFVGMDHNTLVAGDTAALMSAATGTNTVWAYESTNAWVDLSTYALDHSAAVIPVICNSVATGEKEILADINEIMIFPNPTTGTINIALTEKLVSSVEVYNVVGKLVLTTNPLNTQLITVDVSNQPNGVYFVNIKTGGTIITKKVMISK